MADLCFSVFLTNTLYAILHGDALCVSIIILVLNKITASKMLFLWWLINEWLSGGQPNKSLRSYYSMIVYWGASRCKIYLSQDCCLISGCEADARFVVIGRESRRWFN